MRRQKAWLRRRITELEAEQASLRRDIARLRLILPYTDEPAVAKPEFIAETEDRHDLLQFIRRRKPCLH